MKSFQKLYSITLLVFAFIYPSAMAEAKDSNVNNLLHHQNVELETSLVGGDTSPELLLAHRHHRRRYRSKPSTGNQYNRRKRHQQNYHRKQGVQRTRYNGQYYRHGRWQKVRDRHGRLIYDWRKY
ncbi:hypothetical protein [Nodularia sp. NIES-3585]|uniref:hypothetical protein n=1 Tax=Nodularia sp. NIES-3585 TaxID=1973477 RepID=UPI000B5C4624|nr:hypothetical protein [Nodularia sp. NIES-3585]GAX36748.1 hypothetical protein NIES3585_27850 [Nodularia sp. NIES-3585]